MQLVPMKDKKFFALAGLTFSQLKIIKDSCHFAGKNGSQSALDLSNEIDRLMGEISI